MLAFAVLILFAVSMNTDALPQGHGGNGAFGLGSGGNGGNGACEGNGGQGAAGVFGDGGSGGNVNVNDACAKLKALGNEMKQWADVAKILQDPSFTSGQKVELVRIWRENQRNRK